jgi:hypothetical protein
MSRFCFSRLAILNAPAGCHNSVTIVPSLNIPLWSTHDPAAAIGLP